MKSICKAICKEHVKAVIILARNDRLTQQQEAFVLALVAGKDQREAYIEAYPKAARWKTSSVDTKASLLFKQEKVQKKYDELLFEYKEHVKHEAFYDRDEAISDLIWLKEQSRESILENGVKQATSQAYLNCVKELCTLIDLYPNKSQKVDLNVDAVIDNDNPYAQLTTEQLIALAGDYTDEE